MLLVDAEQGEGVSGEAVCCGACRFFAADKGQCRRYAPRPFTQHPQPEDELKLDAFWPWVQPEDWCGEFEEAA